MKETLLNTFWAVLSVAVLPIARLAANLLVQLVKKSPRPEDDAFLKELAKNITEKLK